MNSIKGLKKLVSSVVNSLPALGNVVVFLMFFLLIWAILGVQFFRGIYEYRCRLKPEPYPN